MKLVGRGGKYYGQVLTTTNILEQLFEQRPGFDLPGYIWLLAMRRQLGQVLTSRNIKVEKSGYGRWDRAWTKKRELNFFV